MAADATSLPCRNPSCRAAETGKCIEGFAAMALCPHTQPLQPLSEPTHKDGVQAAASEDFDFVSLPKGRLLGLPEASAVMASERTSVIAVVGPSDAGKTSLLGRMYDAFQWGPCGELTFCGSRTLAALEACCHKARAASGRTTGAVDHTPAGQGVRFFHLRLRSSSTARPFSLLLADRPGEDFRLAADQSVLADGFVEVQRADHVLLLLDGRRLCDPAERHNVATELQLIVRAMVERNVLGAANRLKVVLTKFDLVAQHAEREQLLERFGGTVDRIRRLTQELGVEVSQHRVAAMPESDAVDAGYGVDDLLRLLCKQTTARPPARTTSTVNVRPFLRLVERVD